MRRGKRSLSGLQTAKPRRVLTETNEVVSGWPERDVFVVDPLDRGDEDGRSMHFGVAFDVPSLCQLIGHLAIN